MPRDRYSTDGSVESADQPGSGGRVLANLLGITRVLDIQQAESDALETLALALITEVDSRQRFTAGDLCDWHRRWFGEIYAWAGNYRQVNISKGGFLFAVASRVPALMVEFERKVLSVHTPCAGMDVDRLVHALAVTHAELILIHPFRDGNGRLTRLFNTLMALQAGLPALDYGGIRGRKKQEYIGAIHAAAGHDYQPLERVFRSVIRLTLRDA